MEITRKQYLLSAQPHNIAGMSQMLLSWGAYLYIGEGLQVHSYTDATGRQYVILGHIFCTHQIDKTIEDDIKQFKGDNINDLLRNWTGRWVVITRHELHIDACGLMSAFYTQGDNWCISSSLALLAQVAGEKPSQTVSDFGLTWQLLPHTLIPNVSALFCTQKLVFAHNGLSVSFNPYITDYSHLSTQDKIARIADILKISLVNIARQSNRSLCLALTAGRDSRLLLAAALASGVPFTTYTAWHENISISDRTLPAQLAQRFSFVHRYIKASKHSALRENEYLTFSSGNSKGADMQFYARGQLDEIPADAVVIRGAIFEAARTYGRSIASADIDGFKKGFTTYYHTSLSDKNQSDAFNKYLKYIEDNPIPYIDVRDRFYIEQRVGGWVAAIEQALDINDWISLQVANSREMVSLLLSATESERQSAALSVGCIDRLYPQLNDYAYNQSSVCDKIRLFINVLASPQRLRRFLKKIIK